MGFFFGIHRKIFTPKKMWVRVTVGRGGGVMGRGGISYLADLKVAFVGAYCFCWGVHSGEGSRGFFW